MIYLKIYRAVGLRDPSGGNSPDSATIHRLDLRPIGINIFGDEKMLHQLDLFEVRLLVAWERLQLYMARL